MNSIEGRMQNTHKIQGHIRSTPKIQGNIRFGNVYPELEDLEITPTEQEQSFKSTKYGYDEVKVKAIEAEEKTAALDFSNSNVSEVTNTSGKYMKKVTINKDEDLLASNIRQGANIYGVEGELEVVDTRDATAQADDVLAPKTFYVDGKKLVGNIQTDTTLIGEGLDYYISTINTTQQIYDVNLFYKVALVANFDSSSISIYKYENHTLGELCDTFQLSEFGTSGTLLSAQMSNTLNGANNLNVWVYAHVTNDQYADVCVVQLDVENFKFIKTLATKYNVLHHYSKTHAGCIAANPVYSDVFAVSNQHTSYNAASGWVGHYNPVTNTIYNVVNIYHWRGLGASCDENYCEWSSNGLWLYVCTRRVTSGYCYKDIYKFTNSTFSSPSYTFSSGFENNEIVTLWNGTHYFYNNTLRTLNGNTTVKTYSEYSVTVGKTVMWTQANTLFVINYNSKKFNAFIIDPITFNLNSIYSLDLTNYTLPVGKYSGTITLPISNHCSVYAETPQSNYKEFYSNMFERINSANIRGTTLYNSSDVETTSDKVLEGSDVYIKGGKVTGTMPNNSGITIIPLSVEQPIPTGYISGGKVAAMDITTSTDYAICLVLSEAILGNANILPVRSGLLLDLEANQNNVTSTGGVVWSDSLNSKSISISNGSVDSDYSIIFNGSNTEFNTGIAQSSLSNGYTVILRVYPTAWNNYRGLFGIHSSSNGIVGLQHENGAIVWAHIGGSSSLRTTSNKIPLNTWTTIAMVYNSDKTAAMYINGVLELSTSGFGAIKALNNLIVGKTFASGERFFKGNMSHCIVYNRGLSQEEVSKVSAYVSGGVV